MVSPSRRAGAEGDRATPERVSEQANEKTRQDSRVSETVGTEVVPDETLRPGGLMVYSDGTEQAEIIEMKAADRVVPLQTITDGDFVLGVASIKPG